MVEVVVAVAAAADSVDAAVADAVAAQPSVLVRSRHDAVCAGAFVLDIHCRQIAAVSSAVLPLWSYLQGARDREFVLFSDGTVTLEVNLHRSDQLQGWMNTRKKINDCDADQSTSTV